MGEGGMVDPGCGSRGMPFPRSVLAEVLEEGMKEMERVPLNLTTETASMTGMTADMGLG